MYDLYEYENTLEKTKTSQSPYRRKISINKPRTRNPSIKTTKSKISQYTHIPKKSNIINIYPNNISNISFDYSKNNEYKVLNYKNQNLDNIIKEKNTLINSLQNQISNYILRAKESLKKTNIQEQIIISLKEQIKQLNSDLLRKKNMIEQNEDIDYKISKLKKDVEKSRDKKLNDDYNESKRHNFVLNNKINNLKNELKEKHNLINRLKLQNENLIKKLKDNEFVINKKNAEIQQLKEENILNKNRLEELEKSFEKLAQQISVKNIPQNNEMGNVKMDIQEKIGEEKAVDIEEFKIMEMKMKSCIDELNEKNMNLKIISDKNNLLNNALMQKNKVIKNLQDEKAKNIKNMNLISSKNKDLNNILKRKNEDLIQYQKLIIEKEKKIKSLMDYLNKTKSKSK